MGTAMGVASLYYLTRHNELQKFMRFSITAEMIFGVVWRAAAAGLVAEVASRRVFVNYIRLKEHQIAENEIKKAMRQWPNAKPYTAYHKKPNSYLWI